MTHSGDDTASHELDAAPSLPSRNVRSIVLVLAVQTLNFFNDNFVKMLFVALAIAVARGTDLGEKMQMYVGAVFTLPYILFAPLAGFLSDRFSKQRVVLWTQVSQVAVFVMFIGALWLRMPQTSLLLSLVVFFLLSTQATILSPAKMGIMKDLAGSRRLGTISGLLQMTMMAGILVGMWAGGTVFGNNIRQLSAAVFALDIFRGIAPSWLSGSLDAHHAAFGRGLDATAWSSSLTLMLIVCAVSSLQIIGALFVQRTPGHPRVEFTRDVMWEHFGQINLLFENAAIRTAVIGKTFFWLVSNALMLEVVGIAKLLHPGDPAGVSDSMSLMSLMLGVGVMVGSLVASLASRKGINLRIVPSAGIAMTIGLLLIGLAPLKSAPLLLALVFTGAAGGCFMVPLYAFVQDRALSHQRARVLAGINLLDSLCGLVAAGVVWLLATCDVSAQKQMIFFAVPTLFAALLTTRLLRPGSQTPDAGLPVSGETPAPK